MKTLKNIESLEIVRSHSKTIQESQFEPVTYFASYKAILNPGLTSDEIQDVSDELAEKAEDDVLGKYVPGKVATRRATMASLNTAIKKLIKDNEELKKEVALLKSKEQPF